MIRSSIKKLYANLTLIMLKKLNKNDIMLKIKYITNLKYRYVTGNLKNTQTLLFYGLPKIPKIFISLPPLRLKT